MRPRDGIATGQIARAAELNGEQGAALKTADAVDLIGVSNRRRDDVAREPAAFPKDLAS